MALYYIRRPKEYISEKVLTESVKTVSSTSDRYVSFLKDQAPYVDELL